MAALDVLIFTVSVGAGHTKAAEAVGRGLSLIGQHSYQIIDAFAQTNRKLNDILFKSYFTMLRYTPPVYRFLYEKAEQDSRVSEHGITRFNKFLYRFMADGLSRLLREYNPGIVVCTHPFPLGVLSLIKEETGNSYPRLAAVVTDFTVHPFWIYSNVDWYFVSGEEQKSRLIKKGIRDSRVFTTGIPIDPIFAEPVNREIVQNILGLNPDQPAVLIMGGGLGLGNLEKIVEGIAISNNKVQAVVVAGKNQTLVDKLSPLVNQLPDQRIKLFGFVSNIHELMEAVDLIITKPGGLTCSEALAKGLPMLLYDAIPGQEQRNADYLHRLGVALISHQQEIPAGITELCYDRNKLKAMSLTAKIHGKPLAAKEVAEILTSC